MATEKTMLCPLMKGPCVEDGSIVDNKLVACKFWITVAGTNPQTGEQINNSDCSFAWMPILMVENSRVNRGTSTAVESFRNEMVKANEVSQQVLIAAAQQSMLIEK